MQRVSLCYEVYIANKKANLITLKGHNAAIIATSGQNLLAHSDQIRLGIDDKVIEMEEEKEPEREENMNASDGKIEHSSKETMEYNSHKSDIDLEDQSKDVQI